MRKIHEITNPASCLLRARMDEQVFVLLGRDAAAPVAIRAWVEERIRLGKNVIADEQIQEALTCAVLMERERSAVQSPSTQQASPKGAQGVTEGLTLSNAEQAGREAYEEATKEGGNDHA